MSISTSIPATVDQKLRELAEASELTRGGYARDVIIQAVARGYLRQVTRLDESGKVTYLNHPENPTARAADGPA